MQSHGIQLPQGTFLTPVGPGQVWAELPAANLAPFRQLSSPFLVSMCKQVCGKRGSKGRLNVTHFNFSAETEVEVPDSRQVPGLCNGSKGSTFAGRGRGNEKEKSKIGASWGTVPHLQVGELLLLVGDSLFHQDTFDALLHCILLGLKKHTHAHKRKKIQGYREHNCLYMFHAINFNQHCWIQQESAPPTPPKKKNSALSLLRVQEFQQHETTLPSATPFHLGTLPLEHTNLVVNPAMAGN